MEIEAVAIAESPDGDHIPGVLRHQIDHNHIDLIRGVHFCPTVPVAAGTYAVAAIAGLVNRLHLYSPQAPSRTHDEVEALAVSVRLGHSESHAHRLVCECQFGELTLPFGMTAISEKIFTLA